MTPPPGAPDDAAAGVHAVGCRALAPRADGAGADGAGADGAGADVSVVLLYPSAGVERPERVGPYAMDVARDAPPAAGSFPLVVGSHGTGGSHLAYRTLAAHLARNGFAVALVEHRVVPNAGHFSFLGPFPPERTGPALPPSQDPPGFDRPRFHEALNAEVLAFLRRAV